jgi:hypothetical protein
MIKQMISTGDNPEINIKTRGDLVVQGWENREISIESCSRQSILLKKEEDRFVLSSTEDCMVWIPTTSKVLIDRVGGDAYIHNFLGSLLCQKIGGDLVMSQMGQVVIDQVGGDCQVLDAAGELELQKVGGDFLGRNIQGSVLIERVGGDFSLQNAAGLVSTRAGGDIQVSLTQTQPGNSNLVAGGDINIYLPEKSDLKLKVYSGCEEINFSYARQVITTESSSYETTLGEGTARMILRAGGSVDVTDQGWDGEILENLEETLENQFASVDEKISSKILEVTECANNEILNQVGKRVEEALRRVELKTQNLNRDRDRHHYNAKITYKDIPFSKVESNPPQETASSVSNQERMMILRMVETKKITVEEAEKLFQSLERK